MQSISIKLDIQCEICENYEYLQHDSGFYVCCVCGTMSAVRHGIYLDYQETNHGKYKIKRKGLEDEDNEEPPDFQNYDSTMNTVVNTCANSEFGDSIATMKSRGKNDKDPKKSLNEILSEHQKIFLKLFKSIYSMQLQKGITFFSKKISNALFDDLVNHIDFSKFFKLFIEKSKNIWTNFISLEYKNQIEKKPLFKQSNTKFRSRRNTDENPNERKQSFNSSTLKNKKPSIKEELKTRKIKQNNIVNIDDNQYSKLKSKDKLKKFIEEYDQVVASLKMEESLFAKEGIELNGNISFKNLLKIAAVLKIPIEENSSFEQVIHQIFVHRNLNLLSLYKEVTYDESKSILTSDNFLSLIYSIFNVHDSKSNSNFNFPILLYRDISELFKNFNLTNLFNKELKFLKYLNRERLLKLLDSADKKNQNSVERHFIHICEDILHLPPFFSKFCIHIYTNAERHIEKMKNHIYNVETFALGVIVYSLKLFYGLNDIPYLLNISQNREKFFNNQEEHKLKFLEELRISLDNYDLIGEKDSLFNIYNQMPSLIKIVENLKNLLKHDENTQNLWEPNDMKRPLTNEYKENYVNYNLNYFSNIENNFTINHINLFEKEINKIQKKSFCEIEQNTQLHVNFSVKFIRKRQRLHPAIQEIRNFLKEECNFYKSLTKKKKFNSCEVPFPCDTYIRFNKKAMKFDGINPPLSELVIMYYFSKYFKVEYKVLKKCCKIIEGAIETEFK